MALKTLFRATWMAVIVIMLLPVLAACSHNDAAPAPSGDASASDSAALRPDAPAPVDGDFRDDPAALVSATGNPQLLEFYTTW